MDSIILMWNIIIIPCADPGGAKGALAPPPSPQNIAPPNSEARAKRALAPPPGAKRALAPPPLQNPGSAYEYLAPLHGFLFIQSFIIDDCLFSVQYVHVLPFRVILKKTHNCFKEKNVCVWLCVCVYIYICVCVGVCVCV